MSQLLLNSLLFLDNAFATQPKPQGLSLAATVLGNRALPKPEGAFGLFHASTTLGAVSYTHLTLPTILRV